jgi:trk system potassium uptake protein TrkH
MPFFDSVCHALVTVATSGCSIKNENIGFYDNPLIYWIIIIFMFIAGTNFSLYYVALKEKSLLAFWRNAEFRLYARIILVFVSLLTLQLIFTEDINIFDALTLASFNIISAITTTGFTIYDYHGWSYFAQALIISLLLIGGCIGSTSGSIKVGRYLILFKQCLVELRQSVHPRAVLYLKMDGKKVEEQLIINVLTYFFLFILLICLGTLVLTCLGLDLLTSFSAVIGCLTNGGIGLGLVGPGQNYAFIPAIGKYMLSSLMLLGRLEIFTVLVLFSPVFWRK